MIYKKLADNMGFIMGALALALIMGALGFQYIGRYAPCQMCHWQRWPLIGAAIIGLIGPFIVKGMSPAVKQAVTTAAILLVALSGAIAVFHAGVEWNWWEGPSSCTGNLFVIGTPADPNPYIIVPCDKPALVIFGLSLAGYNALISLGTAIAAALIVRKAKTA